MEDKLVKYHHKALYFYFKKIGICFSVFLGTSVLVAIPISIAASIRTHQIEQALKEKEEALNKAALASAKETAKANIDSFKTNILIVADLEDVENDTTNKLAVFEEGNK